MNNGALSWRGILSLTLIAGACGTAIVWTNQLTAPKIEAQRKVQARALMLSLLLPQQQQELNTVDKWQDDILTVCSDWWLIRVTENGYAGPIELLAYWQTFTDGAPSALKMRVLRHLETPGIGDFIDHQRNDYLPHTDNLSAADWQVMDTVSGATITHNALRRAATTVAQRLNPETRKSFCDALEPNKTSALP